MTELNNVGTNIMAVASSAGTGTAEGTTLAAFQGWPLAVQVAFLNQNGSGNPPQVVLGPAGSQQGLATLAPDGSVDAETLPDGFTLSPDSLDEGTFSSWSQDVQAAYMQANTGDATSDGATQSLACGAGTTAFTATQPVPAEAYDPSDPTTIQVLDVQVATAAPAASMPAAGLSSLFAVRRLAAAAPPPPTLISSSLAVLTATGYTQADIPYDNLGSGTGQYTVAGAAKTIAGVASTVYATATVPSPSTVSYTTLDPNVFTSWTNAQQLAYLEAQIAANPKLQSYWDRFITIGASNTAGHSAIQAFTGYAIDAAFTKGVTAPLPAPVQVYTVPVGTTYYNLDPNVFETWTTAQQKAFLQSTYSNAVYLWQQGPGDLLPTPLTIGSSNTANHAAIDVFIGAGDTAASPAPVYIAQNLQKTDIAKMSFADQMTLTKAAGYPALAAAYNLIPNATTPRTSTSADTADALTTIQTFINGYRNKITGSTVPAYVQSLFTAQIDLISAQLFGTALPAAPVAGASSYTSNLNAPTLPSSTGTQKGGSAIFSETDLKTQLDAIQTRFTRVAAFASQATLFNHSVSIESFNYTIEGDSTIRTYTFNLTDNFGLYSYRDTNGNIAYTTDPRPLNRINFQKVQTTYDIDSLGAYLQSQGFGADAAGVHTVGTLTCPQSEDLKGATVVLNGQTVSVGSISDVVMQNTQIGFNTTNGLDPLPASTDGDATIRAGYEKFVAQESAIMANKMLAANLAQTGTVAGSNQSLDLPKLLCLYMMYNNNIQNAVVSADSEEVNQVNAVLQEYASAQQIINATTATSTNDANAQLHLQYGSNNVEISRLFQTSYFYNRSPIETMYFGNSWRRPLTSKFVGVASDGSGGGGSDTANNWTQYGTQLTDVVTQINQQSQIKMNDINSETKQQDRYFELASTALSKLSDTLSQIASAT